jgi:hypothetical protein
MKKPKLSSSATPPQPETKPVEAKPVQENRYPLRDEMDAARRFPSVFELAQIAAVLNGNENWRKFVPDGLGDWPEESVAKSALGLWQQCREVVLTALMMEQFEIAGREAKRKANSSAWETALRKVKFPLEFDQALKLIMGEKTRRADRYKLFRHFLQENHGSWIEQKSDVGFEAEEIFTTFKAQGFGNQDFRKCAACFLEWRAQQTKLKARRAAETRWASQTK